MVPNSVPSLWVSARFQAKPVQLKVHGRAERLGFRKWLQWAIAMDPVTDLPLVVLDGLVGTEISKGSAQEVKTSVRSPYYSIDWKPDVSTLSRSQIETLVASGAVTPDYMLKLTQDVEKLAFGYIYRCLDKLATNPIKYALPHHHKYVAWMQHTLDRFHQGGILMQNDSFLESAKDDAAHKALADRLKANSPDGRAIATVGDKLWEILTGEIDALQLLFTGNVLSSLYSDGIGLGSANEQLSRYLNLLAHKNSALNIVELGAGTGGATVPVLEALSSGPDGVRSIPRFQNYDFTDLSIGFFEKAQEKFKDFTDRMRFRVLDVEKNPIEQGYNAGSYDVAIAANVLHATKSIERTLANVRRLMKPGGKLVLLECTAPKTVSGPFVFGPLPGWWLGEEPGRQLGPLLDVDEWTKALAKTGFSLDAVLQGHPGCAPEYQATSVLVSTACEIEVDPELVIVPAMPSMSILYDARLEVQREVCSAMTQLLRQRGTNSTVIERNDFDRLIEENSDNPCLSILDLGTDLSAEPDSQSFEILKRACRLPVLVWLNEGGGGAPPNPFAESIVGLARAARWENLGMKFSVLSFAQTVLAPLVAETALGVMDTVIENEHPENQYVFADGMLEVPRMLVNTTMNDAFATRNPLRGQTEIRPFRDGSDRALKLVVGSPGLMDSLHFDDDEVYDTPLQPWELEVEVKATGLSFHDVLVALGRVEDPYMSAECAGYVSRVGSDVKDFKKGDRVITVFLGGFRSYARGNALLAKKLPDDVPFSTAVATPVNLCSKFTNPVLSFHLVCACTGAYPSRRTPMEKK